MTLNPFVTFETARLLVIDDDPILREFAIAHLSTSEVEVSVAEDGEAGWHALGRETFDIVLLDLNMPHMDGFELLGLIRGDARLKHLPVVVATGREDMVAVDKAFASGATSFVVKPLNWRLISHQFSYVLRSARDEAAIRETVKNLHAANRLKSEVLDLTQVRLIPPLKVIGDLTRAIDDAAPAPEIAALTAQIERALSVVETVHQDMVAAARLIRS